MVERQPGRPTEQTFIGAALRFKTRDAGHISKTYEPRRESPSISEIMTKYPGLDLAGASAYRRLYQQRTPPTSERQRKKDDAIIDADMRAAGLAGDSELNSRRCYIDRRLGELGIDKS